MIYVALKKFTVDPNATRQSKRQQQSIEARKLLTAVCMKYLNCAIQLHKTSTGKPVLIDSDNLNPIAISISHSGNFAAIAVSRQLIKVGIDIEQKRPKNTSIFLRSILNEDEFNNANKNTPLLYWCAKEAYAKAHDLNIFSTLAKDCLPHNNEDRRFDWNTSKFTQLTALTSNHLEAVLYTSQKLPIHFCSTNHH